MGWDGVWNGEGGWGWGVRGERVGARWGTKRRSRDAAPPRRRAVAVRGGRELIKAAVPLRCAALRARRQPGSTPPRTAPQPPPPPMVLPGPPGMARSEEVHRLTENVYKVSPATGAGPRGASPASPPHPSSICFGCLISLSFLFPSSAGRGGSAVLGREEEEEEKEKDEEDVNVDVPRRPRSLPAAPTRSRTERAEPPERARCRTPPGSAWGWVRGSPPRSPRPRVTSGRRSLSLDI